MKKLTILLTVFALNIFTINAQEISSIDKEIVDMLSSDIIENFGGGYIDQDHIKEKKTFYLVPITPPDYFDLSLIQRCANKVIKSYNDIIILENWFLSEDVYILNFYISEYDNAGLTFRYTENDNIFFIGIVKVQE